MKILIKVCTLDRKDVPPIILEVDHPLNDEPLYLGLTTEQAREFAYDILKKIEIYDPKN